MSGHTHNLRMEKKKGRHGCVNVPFVSRCDCKTKNSVVPIRDRLTLNTHSWPECVLTGRQLPGQRSVSRCQTRAALQQVPSVASVCACYLCLVQPGHSSQGFNVSPPVWKLFRSERSSTRTSKDGTEWSNERLVMTAAAEE